MPQIARVTTNEQQLQLHHSMPKLVGNAVRVVEVDGVLSIDEFVGNVGSQSDQLSIAVVKVASPTSEPWLTVAYDEFFVITKGVVSLKYVDDDESEQIVTGKAGQTLFVGEGERFQLVVPEGDSEFVPVCIPAFKPERCQRENNEAKTGGESAVTSRLKDLHGEAAYGSAAKEQIQGGPTDHQNKRTVYHMCQKELWDAAIGAKTAYFPPTFAADGHFTHATAEAFRLLETANHFYADTKGDWICVALSVDALRAIGIDTRFEAPMAVGDKDVAEEWKDKPGMFPHVYGGIPAHIVGIVESIYPMRRDADGKFLSIDTVAE